MDLESAADALYALPPEEFVAARSAVVKQAKAVGDSGLATSLRSLRKPTLAAWLVNQLVRQRPEAIQPLLDLGDELREVMPTLSSDDLRDLTRQRFRLVSSLVDQARSLAREHGRALSDNVAQDVRATLDATLSNPGSAELVAEARLADALHVSGFGVEPGRTSAGRKPLTTDSSGGATVTDLDAERRRRSLERAQEGVRAATTGSQEATTRHRAATARLEERTAERHRAESRTEQLRRELDQAEAEAERR
ncbi:MAG: hypothetical protein ACRDPG_09535, partial [Nocardioidaceae bacterium]